MRMKKSKMAGILLLAGIVLSGCNKTEATWAPVNEEGIIKIAIIGDDEYIEDNGTMEAMELASDDFYEKTGIRIETIVYDDDSDYNQGIQCAKDIVLEKDIAAVIVKQELDYIDAVAEIFEEAKLPFIITNGCYESTIQNAYEYMLVDCLNAEIAGSIMGQYAKEMGYKYVAFCHSDTTYEEDELKGFQAELEGSDICLIDTAVGPYTQEEFNEMYRRWEILGVDVVCVSNYDILNSDVVTMLRKKGSDIHVIGDYVMDTDEDIETNGEYLEGTAIVAMYVNDENENNVEITERFENRYKIDMSEKAIQSYDIIYMLGEKLSSGITESIELVQTIKKDEGYRGVSGILSFDERGCLVPNGNEVLIFKDGAFIQPES